MNCSVLDASLGDCLTGGEVYILFNQPRPLNWSYIPMPSEHVLRFLSPAAASIDGVARVGVGPTSNTQRIRFNLKPIAAGSASSFTYDFMIEGQRAYSNGMANGSPFDVRATVSGDQLESPAVTNLDGVVLTDPAMEFTKVVSGVQRDADGSYPAFRGQELTWQLRVAHTTGGKWGTQYGHQIPSKITWTDTLPEGLDCSTVIRVRDHNEKDLPRAQWNCEGRTLTIEAVWTPHVSITQKVPADFQLENPNARLRNTATAKAVFDGVGTQTADAQAEARLTSAPPPELGMTQNSQLKRSVGFRAGSSSVNVAEKGAPEAGDYRLMNSSPRRFDVVYPDQNGSVVSSYRIRADVKVQKGTDFRGWSAQIVDNLPCRDGVSGSVYTSPASSEDVAGSRCQDPAYNPYRVLVAYQQVFVGDTFPRIPHDAMTRFAQASPPVAILTDGTRVPLRFLRLETYNPTATYDVPREYWGQVVRIETSPEPAFSEDPAWAGALDWVEIRGYADQDLPHGAMLVNSGHRRLIAPGGDLQQTVKTNDARLQVVDAAWSLDKSETLPITFGRYVVDGDAPNLPPRGRQYTLNIAYAGEPLRAEDELVIADLLPRNAKLDRTSTGKLPTGKIFFNRQYNLQKHESPLHHVTVDPPEIIDNYAGTGRTLIRWKLPVSALADLPDWKPLIQGQASSGTVMSPAIYPEPFRVELSDPYPDTIPGSYVNQAFIGGTVIRDQPVLLSIGSSEIVRPDPLNIDDVLPTVDRPDQVYRDTVGSTLAPPVGSTGMSLRKEVKGEGDTTFHRAPSVGNASHRGSVVEYQVTAGAIDRAGLRDTVIYERIPKAGDTGILLDTDRGSTLDASFVKMTAVPAGGSVQYSTAENPCFPGVAEPAGCENAPGTWSATVPRDPSTVTALRFSYRPEIYYLQEKSFSFEVRVPPMSGEDAVWNSVTGVTTPVGARAPLNPIEAPKVGVKRTSMTGLHLHKKWVDAAGAQVAAGEVPAASIEADVRWRIVNAAGKPIEGNVQHRGASVTIPAEGAVLTSVKLDAATDWRAVIDEELPLLDSRGNRVEYSLEETTAIAGWESQSGEIRDRFKAPCGAGAGGPDCDGAFEIELTNQPATAKLRLVKAFDVSFNAPQRHTDWVLTATGDDPDAPLTFTGERSLADAEDAFVEVQPGTFRLSESYAGADPRQAAGYQLENIGCSVNGAASTDVTAAAEIMVSAGDRVVCTFTNVDRPGTVTWVKNDPDGRPLAGSTWSLRGPDGFTDLVEIDAESPRNAATDVGAFTVNDLPWGEYTLTEVSPPPGFELEAGTTTFVIDGAHLRHRFEGDFVNRPFRIGNLPFTGVAAQIGLAVLLGCGVIAFMVLAMRRSRSKMDTVGD